MSLYLDPNEQNSSKKREMLAIILILGISAYFFMGSFNKIQQAEPQNTKKLVSPVNEVESTRENQTRQNDIQSSVPEQLIKQDTAKYKLEFSSYFGQLKNIIIKEYKNAKGQPFNITPNLSDQNSLPLVYQLADIKFNKGFSVEKKRDQIIFSQTVEGITLQKIYTFSNNYDIHLKVVLSNSNTKDITTKGYLTWGLGLGPFLSHEKMIQYDKIVTLSYYDAITNKEVIVKDESIEKKPNTGWVSISNRYFTAVIIPLKAEEYNLSFLNQQKEKFYQEKFSIGNQLVIPAGGSVEKSYTIYMGPKKKEYLAIYNRSLEQISERGWFFFPLLGEILISIVTYIKNIVGNYGVAILIFAVLLRLLFHRLNLQSLVATARQGELQAKIQGIKDKYPDKQVQNIKIMELYRQEGVSPLKGCLPLLIQIPFFISFYQQLPGVVELVNSHFLWIKDLSSPDALFYLDSFKNNAFLPYRFNLLPIFIALLTVIQSVFTMRSQGGAANQQMKMMIYIMPIVFLFILWNAPAALSLYWLGQTLANILGQLYFIRNKERIMNRFKEKKKEKRKYITERLKR